MKKVPRIRFKGFTDAWEQRKLGELCNEFRSGEFIKAAKITPSGEYPVYGGNGLRGYTDTYNHDGEFALVGRQGALCGNMQVSCGKAYFTEHAVAVSANTNNETRFLYHLCGTMSLGQYSGQSAQPGLAVSNIVELKTLVPIRAEQTQISTFFSHLDHLITLHQRECDKLIKIKKALLEKMFPREGSDRPEIRFAGFTDAWEQRKLGELLSESRILGSNGLISRKLTVRLRSKGVIAKYDYGSEATRYYIRKSGQFIYGKLDFLNSAFGIIPPELDGYESTLDMPAFDISDELNGKYLLEYVSKESFYLKYGNVANGSRKAKRIHSNDFLDMMIIKPEIDEQAKIAELFTSLDHLITLHQRELKKLQNIKKALLEKMFP